VTNWPGLVNLPKNLPRGLLKNLSRVPPEHLPRALRNSLLTLKLLPRMLNPHQPRCIEHRSCRVQARPAPDSDREPEQGPELEHLMTQYLDPG
jgi:hypothetical protein